MEDSGDGSLDLTASLDSMDGLLVVLGIRMGMEAAACAGAVSESRLGPAVSWSVAARVSGLGPAVVSAVEERVSCLGPAAALAVEVRVRLVAALVVEAREVALCPAEA